MDLRDEVSRSRRVFSAMRASSDKGFFVEKSAGDQTNVAKTYSSRRCARLLGITVR